MNTPDRLFQILNNSGSLDGHRNILREYLIEQVAAYKRQPGRGEEIAYEVAGLMGAQALMNLSSADPFGEVLSLAGDLELPPHRRDSTSTWERFADLVGKLPTKP